MRQIKGKFKGEIDVKRFYLPGIDITSECPKCGKEKLFEGLHDYISNPVVGEAEKVYFYCCHCENEWQEEIIINVNISFSPSMV